MNSDVITLIFIFGGIVLTCIYEAFHYRRLYPETKKKTGRKKKTEAEEMEELFAEFRHLKAEQDAETPRAAGETVKKNGNSVRKSVDRSLEDDDHDWLAGQLRSEQKSYREVSEMFEVRMSHMSNCAAENLKLDHARHCDAKEVAEQSRK